MGCEVTWKLLWAGARAAACGGVGHEDRGAESPVTLGPGPAQYKSVSVMPVGELG